MSAKRLSLAFSVALAVSPILAYAQGHAHSSGGSSGGGSHSSGGHSGGGHSSSGSHAVPRGQGSGGSGPQYRHPQAGTGTGYRYGGHSYHSGHGYYGHGYGHGYYGHGYYPYYGYGYGYGYPYWGWGLGLSYSSGYPYYSYDDGYYAGGGGGGDYSDDDGPSHGRASGAVRFLVDPDDAKVYVDGAYAGAVDDYDGMSERLYLPPGRHEILLRREGYRSQRFKVYVSPDNTVKISYGMEKGTGDAPQEVVVGDPSAEQYARDDRPRYDDPRRHEGADRAPADSATLRLEAPRGAVAPLRLNVKPDDASVYVDGRFYGTAREASRLHLAPGRHRIEVVRPGYRTYDHEIDVSGDSPTDLDVTLDR